jgi:hypothetical protein
MQSADHLRLVVEAGTRAPSGDNCQPWLFRVRPGAIDLFLDPRRSDFFVDYDHTASFVSLGAAIENMVLAASGLGLEATPALFPDPRGRSHVATLHLAPSSAPAHPLAAQIEARCTNRRRFRRELLPMRDRAALEAVAAPTGAALHLATDRRTLRGIASAVSLLDRTIFEHPRLHGDLFRWVRWTPGARDGLALASLELGALDRSAFRLMSSWRRMRALNLLGLSVIAGKKNSHLLTHAAAIGLVTTAGRSGTDYVEGGRYFERLWLTSTALGLSLQPCGSSSFIVARQRGGGEGLSPRHRALIARAWERLEALFPGAAGSTPVILFRLGRADPPSARSARREITEVVLD